MDKSYTNTSPMLNVDGTGHHRQATWWCCRKQAFTRCVINMTQQTTTSDVWEVVAVATDGTVTSAFSTHANKSDAQDQVDMRMRDIAFMPKQVDRFEVRQAE